MLLVLGLGELCWVGLRHTVLLFIDYLGTPLENTMNFCVDIFKVS